MVRSGGGVLCIAAAQLVVGIVLLGIYESYKNFYYNKFVNDAESELDPRSSKTVSPSFVPDYGYASPLDFRSPMGFIFYLAIINNIFSVCGLAGVLNAQRELVIGFFSYNAAQMVVSFHYFIDMCVDAGISYTGEPMQLSAYEKAAAAFIFMNFLLSVAATTFAVKALDEIKAKQREEYNRLTVLSDTLQYEADT